MRSNRDFYSFIAEQLRTRRGQKRSLEHYLLSLRELLHRHCERPGISLDDFAECLSRAFDAPVPPYDPAWSDAPRDYQRTGGYEDVERMLRRQIVDLRDMDESGALKDELRYYGKNAPRGSRWYNFDPLTFIECGARGAFGGWEEGDDTGVELVPGEVAVLGDEGMEYVDPRSLAREPRAVDALAWKDVTSFLGSGQTYE